MFDLHCIFNEALSGHGDSMLSCVGNSPGTSRSGRRAFMKNRVPSGSAADGIPEFLEENMDKKSLRRLNGSLSRRDFLRQIPVFALLSAGWIFLERNPAFAGTLKISQKIAHYQSHPDQGKMCMNCTHFLPGSPEMKQMMENMAGMGQMMQGMRMGGMNGKMMGKMGLCEVVEGPVSPMGYCRFYSPIRRS